VQVVYPGFVLQRPKTSQPAPPASHPSHGRLGRVYLARKWTVKFSSPLFSSIPQNLGHKM